MRRTRLAHGHGHAENGVGTQFVLVVGAIQLQHEVVDRLLVDRVEVGLHQLGSDDAVNIIDRLGYTFAMMLRLVLVAELQSLVDTWGNGLSSHDDCRKSAHRAQHKVFNKL